jgi:tetratricopeptide (TPR) repeat protein
MAPLAYDLCFSYNIQGQYVKITEVAPKVIPALEKSHKKSESFGKPINVYSVLHGQCGWSLGWLGKFAEASEFCEKGISCALEVGHLASVGLIEVFYSGVLCIKGDGSKAIHHALESIKYLEESGAMYMLGLAWNALGIGHYLSGESKTALELMEKGRKIQADLGIPFFLSLHHSWLSRVLLELGASDQARSHVEEALNLSERNNERQFEGYSRILLGRILGKLDRSQFKEAEGSILRGLKMLEELGLRPFFSVGRLFLGELYSNEGQKEKALENLKRAESMFQEMGMDYWLGKTQKVLARL